jgi:hypothetical protein
VLFADTPSIDVQIGSLRIHSQGKPRQRVSIGPEHPSLICMYYGTHPFIRGSERVISANSLLYNL